MSDRARRTAVAFTVLSVFMVCALGVVCAYGSARQGAQGGSHPSSSASATATPSAPGTITVAAVGDMCFATSVRRLIARKGPKAPFSAVRGVLAGADVTIGNLECALSKRGTALRGKTYTFEGPPSAVQGLKWAGFDLVAQANNHARDFGGTALADTIGNLNASHIAHAGAGANSAAAFRPAYITRNGAKIAYLSYSQIGPSSFRAGKHRSGTAYTTSLRTVTRAIKAAKKKAVYVIVAFHWGIERRSIPTARQIEFGRAAIRAGANLVLSHHPHVIQGVEFYRSGLIAYSLGNFVFSPGSAAGHDTLVLSLTLGPKGIRNVTARPMHIDGSGRPVPAKGTARRRILNTIKRTSEGRKTHVSTAGGVAKLRR